MVAEISGAGLGHSVVSQVGSMAVQHQADLVRGEEVVSSRNEVPSDKKDSAATQVVGSFAKLLVSQDGLNKAASAVREVGNTVEKASKLLDKIESGLGEIVKMYPPYPIDSSQRVSLLNDSSGLRKQVEALTFPPQDAVDAVANLLGVQDASVTKADDVFTNQDKVSLVKDKLWDLPALDPLTASDAEVGKALDQVKVAKTTLEAYQAEMWSDVVSFVKRADSHEAQNEALGVRAQIADLGDRGIGINSLDLVQMVESR